MPFKDVLTNLKRNVSRSDLPSNIAITQIRKLAARLGISVTVTATAWGPEYFTYPSWRLTNLEHWWPLGEIDAVAGSGGIRDNRGSTNGTLVGTWTHNTYHQPDPITRTPLRFFSTHPDKIDHSITIGTLSSLNGIANLTVGARVRPHSIVASNINAPSSQKHRSVIFGDIDETTPQFVLEISVVGEVAVRMTGSGVLARTSSGLISPNEWYDILVRFNGGATGDTNRLKIDVNGENQTLIFDDSVGATTDAVNADYSIGSVEAATDQDYFFGDIHDVVVWLATLSDLEALSWYNDNVTDRVVVGQWKTQGDPPVVDTPVALIRQFNRTELPTFRYIIHHPITHNPHEDFFQ